MRQRIDEGWLAGLSTRAALDSALLLLDNLQDRIAKLEVVNQRLSNLLESSPSSKILPESDLAETLRRTQIGVGQPSDKESLHESREESSPLVGAPAVGSANRSTIWDSLELDFQFEFRGSSDLIQSRLAEYLSDVLPVAYLGGRVLDVGCGRGDWLELLQLNSVSALGVDTDQASVEDCLRRGLDAQVGDAIELLEKLPEDSLSVVTAFHVVEHLPLEALLRFIKGALRCLRSGGLLLLETPNPANLAVAMETFYLDPTHLKPIPHSLLSYLVTKLGAEHVETRFLKRAELEVSEDEFAKIEALPAMLRGALVASPDYSVLAFK